MKKKDVFFGAVGSQFFIGTKNDSDSKMVVNCLALVFSKGDDEDSGTNISLVNPMPLKFKTNDDSEMLMVDIHVDKFTYLYNLSNLTDEMAVRFIDYYIERVQYERRVVEIAQPEPADKPIDEEKVEVVTEMPNNIVPIDEK